MTFQRKMKFFSTILFISVLNFSFSQDCKYTFLGELTDFHDKSPLIGATIYIQTLDKYIPSDEYGKFKIENICKGNLTLTISHIACETKTVNYAINGDTFKEIFLEHHLEELDAVSINTKVTRAETKTAQEAIVKVKTIEDFSSGNLGDITKTIAGVSSLNTGTNIVKPIIHGLHSSRVITIQNGVRMQDQEWGLEHAPTVDVNTLQEINLVKGAAALAYSGEAIGGAIILKPTKIFKKDSLFGKAIAAYNSNTRGYSLTSSLFKTYEKGWYLGGQGSYRRFGDAQTADYVLSNTGLDFKAFSFQTGYKTFEKSFGVYYSYVDNELGVLSASHIGGLNQLLDAIESPLPLSIRDFTYDIRDPRQRIRHHLVKGIYEQRFSNLGKLTLQYDYQNNRRQEFDRRRGDLQGIPSIDLVLQTHGIQSKFLFDSNNRRKFQTGIQFQYIDNFADPATGVRRLIPDYKRYDLGAFITSEWKFNNDYLFEAAFRYDYNHIDALKFYRIIAWNDLGYNDDFADIIIEQNGGQFLTNPVYNFHNISVALGAKKRFGDHQLAVNYSLSNRAPNSSELFSDGLHQSLARVEVGNLRLDKETANQFSLSYTYGTPKFSVLVEPYINHIDNYIFIAPTAQGITIIGNAGAFLEYEFLSTDALIYGLDFSLNYNLNEHFTFKNSTAFIVGNDLDNDEPLIDMPPFNTINTLEYKNEKWSNLSIGFTSEAFTRQTRFPNYNFLFTRPSTGEEELVDVSTPPSAYHLLHLNSSIKTNLTKKTSLEIGLNIQNIFNTDYRNYLNRLRFFAAETGRNIQIQLKLNY